MRIELEKAQELLLEPATRLGTVTLPLLDAINMVIAEDIFAMENIPDSSRSALDGYAVIGADTVSADKKNPVSFTLRGEGVHYGVPDFVLKSGEAFKISTGGIMPEGADAIVKIEDVTFVSEGISIKKPVRSLDNVIQPGENLCQGALAVAGGTVVSAAVCGVLASMGCSQVKVYTRPKVVIISTGTELCDLRDERKKGQIYNSTGYALAAWCRAMGADAEVLPRIFDDRASISDALTDAFSRADLVITTGGVSVGENDHINGAFCDMGGEIIFHNINIKPGSPTLGGVYGGKLLVGLSGNPAAALIPFNLLVQPVIAKMAGAEDYAIEKIVVRIADDFSKGGPTRRFLRAKLELREGEAWALLTGAQSNGVLTSYVGCNLLIDVPAKTAVAVGEKCSAYLIK